MTSAATYAIVRDVSPSMGRCELVHVERREIDVALAVRQHEHYTQCLQEAGCTIIRLPAADDLPDSVFVEDAVVVLDEAAVATRPGALSRRAEVPAVVGALMPFRAVFHIEPPGTLDGGDVLRIGKTLYVGTSTRTNVAGMEQLRDYVAPAGYAVVPVEVRGCLHLKSAATLVAEGTVLLNPEWIEASVFSGLTSIAVDSDEPLAANALRVGGRLLFPDAYSATRERLEAAGIRVTTLDVSELAKAEGGVTCCSVIFGV